MTATQTEQGSLLDLIAEDVVHTRDREAIERAIRHDAAMHDGHVDPNRVREALPSWVQPQVVGAVYQALRKTGVLVKDGWTVNSDLKGRNSGKPARTYRLVAA